MSRRDRDDLTAQRQAVADSLDALQAALRDLADCAKRAARSKAPDTLEVSAAYREVQLSEEALNLAAYDLATAGGEDG